MRINKKQYLPLYLLFFSCTIFAQTSLKDSLENALGSASKVKQKLEIMTHLMDACRREEQVQKAKDLYRFSDEVQNNYYKEIALTEIIRYYINTDAKDSADYYIQKAEQELSGKTNESMLIFMRMMQKVRIVYYTDSEEKKELIRDNLVKLETQTNLPPLEKAAIHYILGMSMASTSRPDDSRERNKEILSHFETALKLTESLPLRHSIWIRQSTYLMLCTYSTINERAQYAAAYMDMLLQYEKSEEMQNRPYTSKRHMLNACTMLAASAEIIGKEKATFYYEKFLYLNKHFPDDANVTPEYEYLLTSLNYYSGIKAFKRVIGLCDSMYTFLNDNGYKDYVISCVQQKIAMYDSLQMYKEAYQTYQQYTVLQDSSFVQKMRTHLDELEIKKNADQLIIEKTALQLELEKSRKQNYFFVALFLLALCATLYIFFRLGKMKSLYRKLQDSNQQVIIASEKAQESERMKNAFIKNMCHEVRTPLNAINGFSELITAEETTPAEKKEFSKIIYANCNHLTVMMNNVIEIAQLDSNSDKLTLVPEHLYSICMHEMDTFKKAHQKPTIDYRVSGDAQQDLLPTNRHYFSLVISHLLNNANKFTEKGNITVAFARDEQRKEATITVSDTGCGIPEDKQEWIFERFTKNDDFVPGSGLGLYLCRMIIQRLGGEIHVDPEYTDGARFVITLPLEQA